LATPIYADFLRIAPIFGQMVHQQCYVFKIVVAALICRFKGHEERNVPYRSVATTVISSFEQASG
jgi:hypothetical protein